MPRTSDGHTQKVANTRRLCTRVGALRLLVGALVTASLATGALLLHVLGHRLDVTASLRGPPSGLLRSALPCGPIVNVSLRRRVASAAGGACAALLPAWSCALAAAFGAAHEAWQAPATLPGQARCLSALSIDVQMWPWHAQLEHAPLTDALIRVGVVVLVHRWWRSAVRLLSRLLAAQAALGASRLEIFTVVHVDPRSATAYMEMRRWAADQNAVEVFQRFNITRGGEHMLSASLDGFQRLLAAPGGAPDFSLLLSESHYPIRSYGEFYSFLALYKDLSFVGIHKWLGDGGSLKSFLSSRARVDTPMLSWETQKKQRTPMFECGERVFVEPSLALSGELQQTPYVAGPQWVALSGELLEASVAAPGGAHLERNRVSELVRQQVRLFAQPDESFFQTLLFAFQRRDVCDSRAAAVLGYSLTWNEGAEFVGADPASEAKVTSPPLLTHLDEWPDVEIAWGRAWSVPALFARKLDANATRRLQNRLDAALDAPSSWKADPYLQPLCTLLGAASAATPCRPRRRVGSAPRAAERHERLIVELALSPATGRFAVERWAPRPRQLSALGLRVLALRVGRAVERHRQRDDEGLWGQVAEAPELWQASVLWPGSGEVGLLAHLEVLPFSLDFVVEWAGPGGEPRIQVGASAAKQASYLWVPLPAMHEFTPGEWSVALQLSHSAPSGPRLLAWRRFAVVSTPGDSVQDSSEKSAVKDFISQYFELEAEAPWLL